MNKISQTTTTINNRQTKLISSFKLSSLSLSLSSSFSIMVTSCTRNKHTIIKNNNVICSIIPVLVLGVLNKVVLVRSKELLSQRQLQVQYSTSTPVASGRYLTRQHCAFIMILSSYKTIGQYSYCNSYSHYNNNYQHHHTFPNNILSIPFSKKSMSASSSLTSISLLQLSSSSTFNTRQSRLYGTTIKNDDNDNDNINDIVKIDTSTTSTTKPLIDDNDNNSSNDCNNDDSTSTIINIRKDALNTALTQLNIVPDITTFDNAVQQSIYNPIQGYDGRYGKSAIKAYRSFVYSKSNSNMSNTMMITTIAQRTARQIQFLLNRHKAHQIEWIRHHDGQSTGSTNSNSDNTIATTEQQVVQVQQQQQQELNTKKFPIILVLDNVRSAMNVGNIFRTADASGCEAIYTVGITPHPYGNGHDKLIKAALGTQNTVVHEHFISLQDAIQSINNNTNTNNNHTNIDSTTTSTKSQSRQSLLKSKYTILCMETTSKSICYTDYKYGGNRQNQDSNINVVSNNVDVVDDVDDTLDDKSEGVVLVLGNEVTGVNVDFMNQYADAIIEIPMYGIKNSLNIAACAPIVIYEILRQWNIPKRLLNSNR